jgi:hypothetical protein
MATITATKAGNWSDTTVWSGGVLPGVNDVASTAFTITIDQDITVQQLYCTAGTPITGFTAGGATTRNITLTGAGLVGTGYYHTVLTITNSGVTNLTTKLPAVVSNYQLLTISGISGGTVNLNLTGTITYSYALGASITISGTNYTVNVTSADIVPGTLGYKILTVDGVSNTVNWTGNIYGASVGGSAALVFNSATSTLNYTGTIVGNIGPGIEAGVAGGFVNIVGIVTSGAVAGVVSSSSTMIRLTGTVNNVNSISALYCKNLRLYSTQPLTWVFQTEVVGGSKGLYTAGVSLGNPVVTNVRQGITYGASGEFTGTLVVPNPSNVRKGVPVDNTVGTAELTAADFWNTLTSTLTTTGSIGERLKNCSTIDTTGSQLAAQ